MPGPPAELRSGDGPRLRFDSLLVRYLALELGQRLAGRPVKQILLDRQARRLALDSGEGALLFELHPLAGYVRALDSPPLLPDSLALGRRCLLRAVSSPADERVLRLELASAGAGGPARIVVELMTNQWNALVLDESDQILAALWRRLAGGRELRPGARYLQPPETRREAIEQPLEPGRWAAILEGTSQEDRRRMLIERVAWTSSINADWILGVAAAGPAAADLEAAYDRYLSLARLPAQNPQLLQGNAAGASAQPYPLPLSCLPALPCATLLDAFAAAAGRAGTMSARPAAPGTTTASPEMLELLRRRLAKQQRRLHALEEELAGAGAQAETLRRQADILLSQLHAVKKGMASVVLPAFDGGTASIVLEPALSPVENANRLYAAARKRERAAKRLPELIRRVRASRAETSGLLARIERGEAAVAELEALAAGTRAGSASVERGQDRLPPYKRYVTSGGFEVRVGRNRAANDELTFHHSAPGDIWLHARDAAGSHVILRWDRRDENPPARDLGEAAVLAALHSRSRTSRSVAVDWTRRRYVRKPRKAPAGVVLVDRAKTIFVAPDPALERRLRYDADR